MSRGTREIARLIAAMGGNELSAYGLCHLGDYEAPYFLNLAIIESLGNYLYVMPYTKFYIIAQMLKKS